MISFLYQKRSGDFSGFPSRVEGFSNEEDFPIKTFPVPSHEKIRDDRGRFEDLIIPYPRIG